MVALFFNDTIKPHNLTHILPIFACLLGVVVSACIKPSLLLFLLFTHHQRLQIAVINKKWWLSSSDDHLSWVMLSCHGLSWRGSAADFSKLCQEIKLQIISFLSKAEWSYWVTDMSVLPRYSSYSSTRSSALAGHLRNGLCWQFTDYRQILLEFDCLILCPASKNKAFPKIISECDLYVIITEILSTLATLGFYCYQLARYWVLEYVATSYE